MSLLDKLMGGYKSRAEVAVENSLELYKTKLKGLVYDDDVVNELAPIFAKLHKQEGFEKVMELLETKEQQICAISDGEWHQDSSHSDDETDIVTDKETKEEKPLSATEILAKKYENK